MNVLISGGTGLVGRHLMPHLVARGYQVNNLTTRRSIHGTSDRGITHHFWDPSTQQMDTDLIERADVVINLAGHSVSQRWTSKAKAEMVRSRLDATGLLTDSILRSAHKPKVFLSASAIGIYPSSEEWCDENATTGHGFLSDLCKSWEERSAELDQTETRRIIARIGVVLDPTDGALGKMIGLFRNGLGAPVGSGNQWMSWIHIDDLVAAITHMTEHPTFTGIFNATGPQPVTNREFSRELARALEAAYFLPAVPSFVLKMLYGEMSRIVLDSQKVKCTRLLESGFSFRFPTLTNALDDLLR